MKVKKGDTVVVISGNDRGKKGEVLRVDSDSDRVVVRGINLRKKHQRQTSTGGRQPLAPGIVQFEAALHASNVQLVCPHCGKPARVGHRREAGRVVRTCKQCERDVDRSR